MNPLFDMFFKTWQQLPPSCVLFSSSSPIPTEHLVKEPYISSFGLVLCYGLLWGLSSANEIGNTKSLSSFVYSYFDELLQDVEEKL